MGRFLNSIDMNNRFIRTSRETYFVDKSELIEKMNTLVNTSNDFISITKPRRFGQSINAFMLASYYSNALDTKDIFDRLKISKSLSYLEHLNKHNVIFISFNTGSDTFKTYTDYKKFFVTSLIRDLKKYYPNVEIYDDDPIGVIFDDVYRATGERFIFIMDEWDYIFNRNLYSKDDKRNFLTFLTNLLKTYLF